MKLYLFEMVELFKKYGVKYMLTGAFAAGYWGEIRTTADVDFSIVSGEGFNKILEAVRKEGWKIHPPENAAFARFVLKPPYTPLEIDVMPTRAEQEFIALKRRQLRKIKIGGREKMIWIITPEDLVISKLQRWSPNDRVDVLGILNENGTKLDKKYLMSWVMRLRQTMKRFQRVASESKYGEFWLHS